MATSLERHELSLKIVDFFEELPWEDEYNGLDKDTLFRYLQVTYRNPNSTPPGDFFDVDDNFLANIKAVINDEVASADQQTQQTLPQFAATLTELMEKYESRKQKEGSKKAKKFFLTDTQKTTQLLNYQWEIQRQEALIKQGLTPLANNSQDELTRIIERDLETQRARNPNLTQEAIQRAAQEITLNIQRQRIENPQLSTAEISYPILLRQFRPLLNLSEPEINETVVEMANNLWQNQEAAEEAERLLNLQYARVGMEAYAKVLEKKSQDPNYESDTPLENIQLQAGAQTMFFVNKTVNKIAKDLKLQFGYTDEEIESIKLRATAYILDNTANSMVLACDSNSQANFNSVLSETLINAFRYCLAPKKTDKKHPERYLLAPKRNPLLATLVDVVRQRQGKDPVGLAVDRLITQIQPLLTTNVPAELSVVLRAAAHSNYSANRTSIEHGDPLGRISVLYKYRLAGAKPEEIDVVINNMLRQDQQGQIKLSRSQKNALLEAGQYLKEFNRLHPKSAALMSLYYRNWVSAFSVKAAAKILVQQPNMGIFIPYYMLREQWQRFVQLSVRPGVIEFSKKIPLVGFLTGFWYKPNDWGLYENPIERTKHRIQKAVLRKVVKTTSKALIKTGRALHIKKLREVGTALGRKGVLNRFMFKWGFAGGISTGILKKAGEVVGLIFIWAFSHGLPAVLGATGGLIFGVIAGLKVGAVVSGAFGFLGPFSLIPGAISFGLTVIISTGLGAWIGDALGHLLGYQTAVGAGAVGAMPAFLSPVLAAGAATPIVTGVLVTTVGTTLLYSTFIMSGFNPYRISDMTVGQIKMDANLDKLFKQAANEACIPVAALKAISQLEASGVWGYSPDEIKEFSTSGWWNAQGISQSKLERGYCTDTCKKDGVNCAKIDWGRNTYCTQGEASNPAFACEETSVYGPMQFEALTWAGRFGKDNLMERCNLEKSIKAAADKIKSASEDTKSCGGGAYQGKWSESTMKKAARGYCGSCGTSECNPNDAACITANSACGTNYCQTAWSLYKEY